MQAAYRRWHVAGQVHSVETWIDGKLAGGLYGINLGRMFYGESMFAHRTDASKIAFVHLARFLEQREFRVLDCQMTTRHLASLGGREIPREDFVKLLDTLTRDGPPPARWPIDGAQAPWT